MQARKKLYDLHGEKSLTERQCQNWFARFRSGDFDLKDSPRARRPIEVDDDKIKAMIESNQRSTTRVIAEKLNISHTRVQRHLKQLGYVNKLDIWVPHKLNDIQLTKSKSRKSGQNWQLVKAPSSIKITPVHIHLWSLAKNYWS